MRVAAGEWTSPIFVQATMTQTKKKVPGKKEKKGAFADEDEFEVLEAADIDASPSEESINATLASKKKGGKKGKKGAKVEDDEYGVQIPSIDVEQQQANSPEESIVPEIVSKKKGGKKGKKGVLVDDEDFEGPAIVDAEEMQAEDLSVEDDYTFGGKKKGGKKGKKGVTFDDYELEGPGATDAKGPENEDPSVNDDYAFVGKKKGGKKGKKGAKVDDEEFELTIDPEMAKAEDHTVEDDYSFGGKKKAAKKGKKGVKIDDNEFEASVTIDPEEAQAEDPYVEYDYTFGGKKGPKKGKKGAKVDENDFEVPVTISAVEAQVEDLPVEDDYAFGGKKKGGKKGKKGAKVDEYEYEILETMNTTAEQTVVPTDEDDYNFGGKKKGGKKGKKELQVDDDEYDVIGSNGTEALESMKILPSEELEGGSKKKGVKKSSFKKDAFSLLAELNDGSVEMNEADEGHAPESISENLKENGDHSSDEIVFSGKKKAKGKKVSKLTQEDKSNGDALDASLPVDLKEEHPLEETQPGEDEEIVFFGKKKAKKGKKDIKKEQDVEFVEDAIEAPGAAEISSVVTESYDVSEATGSLKKKGKKGKKSVRTAQEEEDLDAILAELEGPKVSNPAPKTSIPDIPAMDTQPPEALAEVEEEVQSASVVTSIAAEPEEVVETAASKKKKKKKEKEKEKKAAAVEKPVEEDALELPTTGKTDAPKGKTAEKKVSKHLKAMQEQLLKLKEAEEKRKREEEEKLRKEEEEQARLEELERQKEEAKKRRKEREKEKLLQKKKDGKLLTGKQKEEARRLALMREQMLSQAGFPDSEGGTGEEAEVVLRAPRKPKYETKNKRRKPGGQQAAEHPGEAGLVDSVEMNQEESNTKEEDEAVIEHAEPVEIDTSFEDTLVEEEIIEEKTEHEEEEEEEEDWDAKSFEDVALPAIKSAFAEDEVEDVKKVVVTPAAAKVTKRVVSQAPVTIPPAKRSASPEKRSVPVTKRPQQKGPASRKAVPPVAEESDEEEETESEDESESEDEDDAETRKKRLAKEKREARKADALTKRSADDLRSPICCILGHVDTGKTKLLDCIRRTNVQEGEAGGITQQIGATYFPMENIRERTRELKSTSDMRVPGLLVIDTPGHESFTNLRARGSSLCDIAILVIDIMHGLEPQTIESLKLLQMRKTPFVVALNKVDRLYDWRSIPNGPIRNSLKLQGKHVVQEFETKCNWVISQLKEQGMNSELYYKNKEIRKVISMVPTSAISGEGIPDLLMLLIHLTQRMMEEKLMYVSEVQCTVLEVKMIEGLGTTIDVVLVNGVLHEGDQIVVCGMQGPIVTSIRALLTPHPMKELRVKGSYEKHKELKAAQGIKITAQGLEHAIAGTQLYVVGPDDDVDDIKQEAMQDMKTVMSRVDKSGEGVCVQASTLGSLEALLEFLKSPAVKIPVSGINIGPVHKKDVMRASVMLERKRKEYATILAFDVKVTQEARELADEVGVKIFTADIIYHLFDQFTNYISTVKEEKKKESAEEAVFPCVLKILPECVFNKKDPIIVGVDVLEGIVKVGTPLCVPSREFIEIGRIASMEVNHKVVDTARKGQAVAMKIIGTNAEETQKMFGRHFEHQDELVSSITRRSIDLLKENYRDDLDNADWKLLLKLKVLFTIP